MMLHQRHPEQYFAGFCLLFVDKYMNTPVSFFVVLSPFFASLPPLLRRPERFSKPRVGVCVVGGLRLFHACLLLSCLVLANAKIEK